jgi:hypothetical protein
MDGEPVVVRLTGSDRHVCFTTREIAAVPMNDAMLDEPTELHLLIIRAVRLRTWALWNCVQSPELAEAVKRRVARLEQQIGLIKRESQTLTRAQWAAKNGLSNYTTAIVQWTGGAR